MLEQLHHFAKCKINFDPPMYQELCSELRLPLQYYISNNLQKWNNSLGLEICQNYRPIYVQTSMDFYRAIHAQYGTPFYTNLYGYWAQS